MALGGSWLSRLFCVPLLLTRYRSQKKQSRDSASASGLSLPSTSSDSGRLERRERRRRDAVRVRTPRPIITDPIPLPTAPSPVHVRRRSEPHPQATSVTISTSSSYYREKRLPRSPLPPATPEKMSPTVVAQVLDWIGSNLDHIPYAVCGLAAMTAYGFEGRMPQHVSLLCPFYSKEVIRCWAAAMGMETYPQRPDLFGIPSPSGQIRCVRIKYIDSGFDDLPTLRLGWARTRVLSPSALVDFIARAYTSVQPGLDASRKYRAYAGDIFWLLGRIIEVGGTGAGAGVGIREEDVPHVRNPLFWDLFECSFPGAGEVFARAGLVVGEPGEGEGEEDFSRYLVETGGIYCARGRDLEGAQNENDNESKIENENENVKEKGKRMTTESVESAYKNFLHYHENEGMGQVIETSSRDSSATVRTIATTDLLSPVMTGSTDSTVRSGPLGGLFKQSLPEGGRRTTPVDKRWLPWDSRERVGCSAPCAHTVSGRSGVSGRLDGWRGGAVMTC